MRGWGFAIVLAFAIVTAAPACAAPCSQPEIIDAGDAVNTARNDLLLLPVGDGTRTDVSPTARRKIAAMKTRLGDFVDAYMNCASSDARAKNIADGLTRFGHANPDAPAQYSKGAPSDAGNYGFRLSFTADRKPAGLIAITATFQIECGDDTMLLIFAWKDGAWRDVLRAQSKPYATVAGAFDSFGYAISPPDAQGRWFAVTYTVAPWCSSNWSEIRFAVLRPDPTRSIFSASDSIFREDEAVRRLSIGVDNFDLRFDAESIDNGVFTREWVRHFSVVGDTVSRIAPIANSPGDFTDEWIVSHWKDAAAWTAPPATRWQNLHAALHAIRYFDYVSIRPCAGDRVQVELEPTDPDTKTANYYFQISGKPNYAMARIARAPDPACRGKNLFKMTGGK